MLTLPTLLKSMKWWRKPLPVDRFFTDTPLNTRQSLLLEGDEAGHIARVLRKHIGERVELVNGQGVLAHAEITALGKNKVSLAVGDTERSPPPPQIILAQALIKPNRLDFVLEKGTELGAAAFWLFPAERSEKVELSETQIKRCRGLTISALKQSGRLYLPHITLLPKLSAWKPLPYPAFFGDTNSNAPLLSQCHITPPVIFFVGPEGGFTEKEELELKKRGAQGVSLHFNILRSETAALASLSLLSQFAH